MTAAILVASSPLSLSDALTIKSTEIQPEIAPSSCVAGALDPAVARKRRREILAAQRNANAVPDTAISSCTTRADVILKKRRILSDCSTSDSDSECSSDTPSKEEKGEKKCQMKYDPDVPMTKDQAAAWRREQRRKRNRDSAAASRQRQRGRISELEDELSQLKARYEGVLNKIRNQSVDSTINDQDVVTAPQCPTSGTADIIVNCVSPRLSPSSSFSSVVPQCGYFGEGNRSICPLGDLEQPVESSLPTNMISRPAVSRKKILLVNLGESLSNHPITARVTRLF